MPSQPPTDHHLPPGESPTTAASAELAGATGLDEGPKPTKRFEREAWADELLGHDFPELAPVVEGLILPGLTILSGRPKTGKSYLALWLAYAVSTGSPVLGHKTSKSSVLYFALEDSPRRIKVRLAVMCKGDRTPIPIKFVFRDVHDVDSVIDQASTWAVSQPSARLVVVDIYGRIAPRGSSGSTEYQVVTEALGRIQAYAGDNDLAILLLHHTRKSTAQGSDAFDSPLGSTAITGIADTNMVLSRPRNTSTSTLHVTGRDIEEFSLPFEFAPDRRPSTIGSTERHTPSLSDERRAVLRAIEDGATTPADIARVVGKRGTNVQNLLRELRRSGHIVLVSRGIYAVSRGEDTEVSFADVTPA